MRKIRQECRKNKGSLILVLAAVVLLSLSAAGSAKAALTYYSENYTAQMELPDIGVTLVEKSAQGSKDISSRDYTGSNEEWNQTRGVLLQDMLKETDGKLKLGKNYAEELSVKNSGNIEEYVRVRIYRNWTNADGRKETSLAPGLIILNVTDRGWLIDESASTEERLVLYWPRALKEGESTPSFSDTLRIDDAIASKVVKTTTQEQGYTTITTTFPYDGAVFHLEAEVDAVQTHNAKDAIKSAWGVEVSIAPDGTLNLAQ